MTQPFDSGWWEERAASEADGHHWRRWRLIDEILQRFYVDLGIQPVFGWMGTELYQVAIASPCCARAPRYFGRLCDQGGVHPTGSGDVGTVNEELGGLRLAPYREHDDDTDSGWHPDADDAGLPWHDYLESSIETLGLAEAGVKGHEACFHRRGRDLTPLMFRIALLLRVGEGSRPIDGHDFLCHVPTNGEAGELQEAVDILRVHDESHAAGAPRTMAVRHRGVWFVLRNDGWIGGGNMSINAGDFWRTGASAERIAIYARDLCP